MKIELEVDASTLHETIGETLRSLSAEKREEICVSVLTKWLAEPHDAERKAFAEKIRNDGSCNRYSRKEFDPYEFDKRMRAFKSTREKMIEEIALASVETFKKKVTNLVETDEQLAAKYAIVRDVIVQNFPAMVQAAMVSWFANSFKDMSSKVTDLYNGMWNQQSLMETLHNRLGLSHDGQHKLQG